jgi:transcriptional regulator with XRE-family HTH domain
MSYHTTTKALVQTPSRALGTRLGKAAIKKGLSVCQIALITGASRTTIYSWFAGNTVTNAYRRPVKDLLNKLQKSSVELIMKEHTAQHTPTDTTET